MSDIGFVVICPCPNEGRIVFDGGWGCGSYQGTESGGDGVVENPERTTGTCGYGCAKRIEGTRIHLRGTGSRVQRVRNSMLFAEFSFSLLR